jgi:phospholipid/cholesterol/gamma-HCH transport system ATP-binding protein
MKENDQSSPILEVKHLKKSFGGKVLHKDINFQLNKGETLALLGGSGTGKSVLLRSLIGLEDIDSGEIIYHNSPIQNSNENQWNQIRKELSYSFQSGALFDSLTVYENLSYPLREHTKMKHEEIDQKVSTILEKIDLPNKGHLMPADLSGGMQKRIGMARSIMLDPEIVLFDEPTAGLDPKNKYNIINLIKDLKKNGLTSIFVSHDIPSTLELCDRILVLSDGIILFSGNREDFLNSQNKVIQNFIMTEQESLC